MLSRTGYRLPTEAEWEYACRAGTTCSTFFGDNEQNGSSFACWILNSHEMTCSVGGLRPNLFGLFDMQGNVCEWCQDASEPYPVGQDVVVGVPAETKVVPSTERVFRGANFRSAGRSLRSASRYSYAPRNKYSIMGFRVARTISPVPK
jgi:formylglycine-generating enzyme required for sulfatase activity